MMEGNAACALSATAANPKTIWCDISARSRQRFSTPRFRFWQGPVLEYRRFLVTPFGFPGGRLLDIRFCYARHMGGPDGPPTSLDDSLRGAQPAVPPAFPPRSTA